MSAKKIADITHTAVRSSLAHSAGYDPDTQTLEIHFKKGGMYRATGVPASAHQALLAADSFGAHFQKHLRNAYEFKRIDPQAKE